MTNPDKTPADPDNSNKDSVVSPIAKTIIDYSSLEARVDEPSASDKIHSEAKKIDLWGKIYVPQMQLIGSFSGETFDCAVSSLNLPPGTVFDKIILEDAKPEKYVSGEGFFYSLKLQLSNPHTTRNISLSAKMDDIEFLPYENIKSAEACSEMNRSWVQLIYKTRNKDSKYCR